MANLSGAVATGWHPTNHQRQVFRYSASLDRANRQFIVYWTLSTECSDGARSPTYYLWNGNCYLYIQNRCIFNEGSRYSSGGRTIYKGFADNGSWLDNHYRNSLYFDRNGDYIGIRRWLVVLGTNWKSGSFRVNADSYGRGYFSLYGSFTWFGATRTFSQTCYLQHDDLIRRCTVSFNINNKDLLNGNTVINIPSQQTFIYGSTVDINKLIPKDIATDTGNYICKSYSNKVKDSFTKDGTLYTRNDKIKIESDIVLYPIWEKAEKTITIKLSGGTYNNSTDDIIEKVKYSDYFNVSKYLGRQFYKFGSAVDYFICDKDLIYGDYQVLKDITLIPHWYGLPTKVSLRNYFDDSVYNQFELIYGDDIPKGNGINKVNFSYNVSPEYEFIGWSTNKLPVLLPDANSPVIKPNKDSEGKEYNYIVNYYNTLYVGEDTPFEVPIINSTNKENRKWLFHDENGINLYPILKYKTSVYLLDSDDVWKPALPYIFDGNKFNVSIGHLNIDNTWKQ